MKNVADMLRLYREEKELVTGGDPLQQNKFVDFKSWREEYEREYEETHRTVSVEEADEEAEAAIKECERLLAGKIKDEEIEIVDSDEEKEDNDLNDREKRVQHQTPLRYRKQTKPTNSNTGDKHMSNTDTIRARIAASANKGPSKADQAREIFAEQYPLVLEGKVARKDVIALFVSDADLTEKGAATYYQKFKKAADEALIEQAEEEVAAAEAEEEVEDEVPEVQAEAIEEEEVEEEEVVA